MIIVKKIIVFLISMSVLGCSNSRSLSKVSETRIQGMYMYMADAALLYRCDNGERVFIRGGEANIQLEREYAEERSDYGARVYADLGGSFRMVEKMDGEGLEEAFFVSHIYEIDGEKNCLK